LLERLARFGIRRRREVLVATLAGVIASAALAGGVAKHLSSGGFDDPGAESSRADALLREQLRAGVPNLLLLVSARHAAVDATDVARAGLRLTQQLSAEPGVSQVVSYWSLGSPPPLRSKDGRQALVIGRIGGDDDAVRDRIETIAARYTRDDDVLSVRVGGFAEVFREVGDTIEQDLQRAEAIALPITLVLLVLVFGSVVAASLPLAIGVLSIMGTFLVLRVIASVTQVSIFALNMTTAMGLGLAIDYSLFVVSRYREELRNGLDAHEAIVRTVRTAGRTVMVSGVTVAASLSALLVFPLAFLRSFAYAGIAVVVMAVLGAVVFLPAVLAALGSRIDSWVLWRRPDREGAFWHRLATAVMRRPLPIALGVVALLLILGRPFLHAEFRLPDDRVLPASAGARQVHDEIRRNFVSNEADALSVVAAGVGDVKALTPHIDAYAAALSRLPGVARVDAVTGVYLKGTRVSGPQPISARFAAPGATFLSVVPSVEALSAQGEQLAKDVRATRAPFPVLVTGSSAQLVDSKASLFGRMPLAGGLIALVTFTLLFLMFGSVLVPLKALVLNTLSLTATFGAMVWIFQDGHVSSLLGFTATGSIDTTTPILMFCIAFGLSMDYEVFLLSRIREEHDRTGDNVSSVAVGLERTGRIVTAAAALLALVFASFATSRITFIKLFGVGLAMAVLMDATLIRGTLVPAFMRLAGAANWWLPASLRRVHRRLGVRELEAEGLPEVEPAALLRLEPRPPVMLSVPVSEFRSKASQLFTEASDGSRFIVTIRGKPVAVVLPYEEVEEVPLARRAR
jgi:RND superfamily putative drug exporter